jgi:hypothetical protein
MPHNRIAVFCNHLQGTDASWDATASPIDQPLGRMKSLERGLALAQQLLRDGEGLAEARHGANGESSARVDGGFARLDAEMSRWFGAEGYHFMVARAVTRAREDYSLPRLGTDDAHATVTLQGVARALRDVPPAEADDLRLRLLATFIAQLDRLLGPELSTRLVTRAWSHGTDGNPLPSDQRTHE